MGGRLVVGLAPKIEGKEFPISLEKGYDKNW
jgi:hypothetical protein